jgi:hypothetical protein
MCVKEPRHKGAHAHTTQPKTSRIVSDGFTARPVEYTKVCCLRGLNSQSERNGNDCEAAPVVNPAQNGRPALSYFTTRNTSPPPAQTQTQYIKIYGNV